MADIVNLRTARKRAQRAKAENDATANRLAHGRPSAERKLDAAKRERTDQVLDQHHIEKGDGQ